MSNYDDQLSEMRRNGLSIDGDNAYKRDLLDCIVGALAFGKQCTNKPPAGHWAELFWEMASAEGERLELLLKERDALLAERDALRDALGSMTCAYRMAVQAGHARITALGGDCDSVERMLADFPDYGKAVELYKSSRAAPQGEQP